MKKQAAGILVYKHEGKKVEVLLVRLGGPIWSGKDMWSIPKGELEPGEDHLTAAEREFTEEVGSPPPKGAYIDLGSVEQSASKVNYIWAVEGTIDLSTFKSNVFEMEWPPKSGKLQEFPENDAADWFELGKAKHKTFPAQSLFFDRLAAHLNSGKTE